MSNIPKIIHQTAPLDKSKWHPIWEKCQNSWKHHFEHWEYRFWTDEDLDEFIKTKYSWFYLTYISYPRNIHKIDAARYFILYEYGGMYVDMDFECIQNFEHMLTENKVYIAESEYKNIIYDKNDPYYEYELFQNALMITPPKNEFWKIVFLELLAFPNTYDVLKSTGPQVIIRAYLKYPELVIALSSEIFSKKNYKHDTIAVHHGTSVWFTS
jgi:mannosyltransferase OCH1-like enzyme